MKLSQKQKESIIKEFKAAMDVYNEDVESNKYRRTLDIPSVAEMYGMTNILYALGIECSWTIDSSTKKAKLLKIDGEVYAYDKM